jgi:predicted kinase
MDKLTQYLTEPFLIGEGVKDPGILKAVFLAGGPGSGKSYVASGLFGIPKSVGVSAYGLKLVNQDRALESMLKKYGFGTDLDDMDDELFRQLTDPDYDDYSGMRSYAKDITKTQQKKYESGRLGMIIDGTGHRYGKLRDKKMKLEEIGYDCYMVFVDTSLEVAQARNMERPRKLKPQIVETSWKEVQKNKESFKALFGSNFILVNNNDTLKPEAAEKKFETLMKQGIAKFISRPIKNPQGKKWIRKQQIMKENVDLPIKVGDTVKMGKFKNKKVVVKSIDWNEKGDLLINGRPALKFRLVKKANVFDEEFGAPSGTLPSPSRKGINKNKSKNKVMMNKKKVKKTLDKYMKEVVYSIVENGENTTILKEQKIKKVVGVFGGRFQPFHPGHLATYKWLKGKVDDAYITTSDLKMPPRHPMNFREKIRHMVKMGVPSNRIVKEKSPYVAKNLLQKYNPETTAVVYVVGTKDAGRLGGKYFKPYTKDMKGFDEHGYILTAPQVGSISGTKVRNLLGNPKIDDSEREKLFKKTFGYFDKGVYNMMRNKFKKLFESYELTDELIKDFLLEVTGTPAGNLDDGPSTYYKSLGAYKKTSKEWLDSIYKDAGWKVVDYVYRDGIIAPEDNVAKADRMYTRRKDNKDHYTSVALTYLDHGQNAGSTRAVNKYKDWMENVVKPLGWQIVDWMGTEAAIDNMIGSLFAAGASAQSYDINDNFSDVVNNVIEPVNEQINSKNQLRQRSKEKELLLMGGAYGHLNHPFDDKNLSFGDFKTLIINTLQGNLSSEGTVTEKTDGQNIMITWKDGKLRAARNKGHIKNYGAGALDINGVKNMFSGRGDIEKAFVFAMRDLQKAIGGLNQKQKDKIFAEGKKFMSLEVIYPKTANVIPYDKALLQFHGTMEYDANGTPIGSDRGSAGMLAGMIKQINQNVQKTFTVKGPFITNLPKVKNFSQRQSYFLGKLVKLQNQFRLKDSDTLADYHQAYWTEYIYNGAKQTDYPNPNNDILVKLVRRWAFLDKSYKVPQIRKDLKDYPTFLNWVLSTDKIDLQRLQKQHIRDWEVLFFELGAEILSNLKDFIAANPSKSAQKIKKDLTSAIGKVKTSTDPKVLNTLKVQLDRLNAIGGLKSVVPSEGITFMFKGKLYKYTGAFAPANQILGMLKFV